MTAGPRRRRSRGAVSHATAAPPTSVSARPTWPALRQVDALDRATLAVVVSALFALYATTTSSSVFLEDDGLFLMSSATLGVSHPPGYPVHTLLGWLASKVPLSTPAFRVHCLSALLGALACGVVGWIVMRRTGSRLAGCLSAAIYGVSQHFWSQAIIAEVYTLNALICFGAYALSLEAAERTGSSPRAAAATYGLGLANHWPLLILASPLLGAAVIRRARDWMRNLPVLAAFAMLAAVLPYAWMIWRSNQDPAISFYGPLSNWHDIFFYISRKGYAAVEASATATVGDSAQFARYAVTELVRVFSPAGAVLAVAGAVAQWRQGLRAVVVSEAGALLASTVLLAFMLGFDFDYLRVAVFRPYPLIAHGVLALWLGSAAAWLLEQARSRGRVWVMACGFVLVLLPAGLGTVNLGINDRSQDRFAEEHARLLLNLVEPDAVLLLYGDTDTGPVGYLHEVEGVRPDVTLYNLQGLVFRNRLLPALSAPAVRQKHIEAFLRQTTRPVYHMTENVVPPRSEEAHFGFLRRIGRLGTPARPNPEFHEGSDAFFRRLATVNTPRDRWERVTRNQLMHQYGGFLGLAQVSDDEVLRAEVEQSIALAGRNYFSLNGMVEVLVEHGTTRVQWEQAARLLRDAEPLRDDTLDAERLGREAYLRGFVAFRLGDLDESQRQFVRSIDIDPRRENGAHLALQQLAQLRAAPGRAR